MAFTRPPAGFRVTRAPVSLRHKLQPGDLVAGDRAYGHARDIAAAVRDGADVLVRTNPETIRLYTAGGQRADVAWLAPQVPAVGAVEFDLQMSEPPENWRSHQSWPLRRAASWTRVRLIAIRPRAGSLIWVLRRRRVSVSIGQPSWRSIVCAGRSSSSSSG